jgi:ribosomal-protein-alanine N-acetyltransferase
MDHSDPNSGLELLRATPDFLIANAGQLWDIEHAAFRNPWNTSKFVARAHSQKLAQVYVYGCHNRIVGYCVTIVRPDRRGQGHTHIERIAIAPDLQRRGYGRDMMRRLIAAASADLKTIGLNVRESNTGAQLFYRSLGFKATSTIRAHYRNGEDAYHFELNLSGTGDALAPGAFQEGSFS